MVATTWKTKLKLEARLGAEVDKAATKALTNKADKEPAASKVRSKANKAAAKALADKADKEPGEEGDEAAAKLLADEVDREPKKAASTAAKKAVVHRQWKAMTAPWRRMWSWYWNKSHYLLQMRPFLLTTKY